MDKQTLTEKDSSRSHNFVRVQTYIGIWDAPCFDSEQNQKYFKKELKIFARLMSNGR